MPGTFDHLRELIPVHFPARLVFEKTDHVFQFTDKVIDLTW